jgi:hypothetical protein
MTIKVPNFKDPEVTKFLIEMLREFERTDKEILSSITANKSLLLYSPSLKVFEIKVSDTGVITATKVSGT